MELLKRYVVYGDDFGLFINNLKQGKHYSKRDIESYVDNKLNGQNIVMLVSHNKKDLCNLSNYKNGKLHGIEYVFNGDEPNVLLFISNYMNDTVHGMRYTWNSNGSLRRLYNCTNYYTI